MHVHAKNLPGAGGEKWIYICHASDIMNHSYNIRALRHFLYANLFDISKLADVNDKQ